MASYLLILVCMCFLKIFSQEILFDDKKKLVILKNPTKYIRIGKVMNVDIRVDILKST